VLTALEKRLFVPDVNPSYYHALGLALSLLYLYAGVPWLKIVIIVLVLWADWLDGATARRYNRGSRAGYIIDVVTDRVSEAFMFAAEADTAPGQIFFLLWLINLALAFYSVHSNKHSSLPLRFVYLVVLIARMYSRRACIFRCPRRR
jgi:phosphatidylglycerophosphate synthase